MDFVTEEKIKKLFKDGLENVCNTTRTKFSNIYDFYNYTRKMCVNDIYTTDYEYFMDNTLFKLLNNHTFTSTCTINKQKIPIKITIRKPFLGINEKNPDLYVVDVMCSVEFVIDDKSVSTVDNVCLFMMPLLSNSKHARIYGVGKRHTLLDGVMDVNNLYIKASMLTNLSTHYVFTVRTRKGKKNSAIMCGITQYHDNNYIPMLFEVKHNVHGNLVVNDKLYQAMWDIRMPDKISNRLIPLSYMVYLFTDGNIDIFTSLLPAGCKLVKWLTDTTSELEMDNVLSHFVDSLRSCKPESSDRKEYIKDYIKKRICPFMFDGSPSTDTDVVYMLYNICVRILYTLNSRCMQYNNGLDVYELSVFNENFAQIVVSYLANLKKISQQAVSSMPANMQIDTIPYSILQTIRTSNLYFIKYIESRKPPSLTKYKPPDHTQLVDGNIPLFTYCGETIKNRFVDPVVIESMSNKFSLNTLTGKKYLTASLMQHVISTAGFDVAYIKRVFEQCINHDRVGIPLFINHTFVGHVSDSSELALLYGKVKMESYRLAQLDMYNYNNQFISILCSAHRLLLPVLVKKVIQMPNIMQIMDKCCDNDKHVFLTNLIKSGILTFVSSRDIITYGYCDIDNLYDVLYTDAKYVMIGNRYNDDKYANSFPRQSEVPVSRQVAAITKLHKPILYGNHLKGVFPFINKLFVYANVALQDDKTILDSIGYSEVSVGMHSICYVRVINHEIAEYTVDEKMLKSRFEKNPNLKKRYDKNGIIRLYTYVTMDDDLVLGSGIGKRCPCDKGFVMDIREVKRDKKRLYFTISSTYIASSGAKVAINGNKSVIIESNNTIRNQEGCYISYYLGMYGILNRSLSTEAITQNRYIRDMRSTNITLGVQPKVTNCTAHVGFLQFHPGRHGNGHVFNGPNGKINKDFTIKRGPVLRGGIGLDWLTKPSTAAKSFEQFFTEFNNMQDTVHCMDCSDIPHVYLDKSNKYVIQCRNNPAHTVTVSSGINLLKLNAYLRCYGFQINYRSVYIHNGHTAGAGSLYGIFASTSED